MQSEQGLDATRLSRALVEWYRHHQRLLPWRQTCDPYAILVSEVMLQQTQVSTVIPYYARFLARFPTATALARASEQEVLALWAGLGYYRRARLLHQAAKRVDQLHAGVFPERFEEIAALPGVGRYTAGAVFSFAYNKPASTVETNTARVLARLFGIEQPVKSSCGQRLVWNAADTLLPAANPREHNYALMELGSLVCTPARPRCEACPAAWGCQARIQGLVDRIPAPVARAPKLARHFAGVIARSDQQRVLVRRIAEGEWHAGLYEFPKVAVGPEEPEEQRARTIEQLARGFGKVEDLQLFCSLKYTVTRHSVTLHVWSATVHPHARAALPDGYSWLRLEELNRLPLPSPQRRIVSLLTNHSDLLGGDG